MVFIVDDELRSFSSSLFLNVNDLMLENYDFFIHKCSDSNLQFVYMQWKDIKDYIQNDDIVVFLEDIDAKRYDDKFQERNWARKNFPSRHQVKATYMMILTQTDADAEIISQTSDFFPAVYRMNDKG